MLHAMPPGARQRLPVQQAERVLVYLLSVGVLLPTVAAATVAVVASAVGVGLWRDLASKSVQVTETVQHAVVYCSHHSDFYSATPGFLNLLTQSKSLHQNQKQPLIDRNSYA